MNKDKRKEETGRQGCREKGNCRLGTGGRELVGWRKVKGGRERAGGREDWKRDRAVGWELEGRS